MRILAVGTGTGNGRALGRSLGDFCQKVDIEFNSGIKVLEGGEVISVLPEHIVHHLADFGQGEHRGG